MKKAVQPVFLVFIFLVVFFGACTPAPTPHPRSVPPTFTPSTIPPTFTPEPPAIDASVKTTVGEAEYNEIQTVEVVGKEYSTGETFEGTVEASSVKASNYNDAVFSYIITGDVIDANGQTFTAIWNEEGNYWFKSENINTDLNATNRTSFGEQLQDMVEDRDLYRMLLTQMDSSFPGNTEAARFWLIPQKTGGTYADAFYRLDMSRADYDDKDYPDGYSYIDVQDGAFTKGNEPYKYLAMIDGIATDLKTKQGQPIEDRPFSVIPMIVQNSDGKTMIWFGGMDGVQREDVLFGSASVDANGDIVYGPRTVGDDGLNGLQRRLINHGNTMSLIIPPADPADWNNADYPGGNNGGMHFRQGSINYMNDSIIAMQDAPGTFLKLLPETMQIGLIDATSFIKAQNIGAQYAIPFEGNAVSPNVIDYLSNHVFPVYFNSSSGSR